MSQSKEYRRQYYLKHKENLLQQGKTYYNINKDIILKRNAKYKKNNPDKAKIWDKVYKVRNKDKLRIRRNCYKYGLTEDQYKQLFLQQENKCAICGKIYDMLCVDHDHKTNKVRGLLCNQCNLILGNAGDNKEILGNAIKYLEVTE